MSEINILILSAGSRNKIVQYFKNELKGKGKVFATDCSEYAPAIYDADEFYIVPRVDESGYLEVILDICEKNSINAVISLIDPELSLISKNLHKFELLGVVPIISEYETIEIAFDKYEMYKKLVKCGIPTVKTYNTIDSFSFALNSNQIDFPVFVKPCNGSASLNINKVNSMSDLDDLFNKHSDLIIQEFMDGTEIGVDAYIDLHSNELVTFFAKEKLKMRAGETDKSISIKNNELTDLVEKLIKNMEFRGIIDIDVFMKDGNYYISEVNPRFGGGYPHAYECGVNIPKMIIRNLCNKVNSKQFNIYKENVIMMKYNEVKIINEFE